MRCSPHRNRGGGVTRKQSGLVAGKELDATNRVVRLTGRMTAQAHPAWLALFRRGASLFVLSLFALPPASANIPKMPDVAGVDVQGGGGDRTLVHAHDVAGRLRALSTAGGARSYGFDNLGTITHLSARYGYPWPVPIYDSVGNPCRKVTGIHLTTVGVRDYEGHALDARDGLITNALCDRSSLRANR